MFFIKNFGRIFIVILAIFSFIQVSYINAEQTTDTKKNQSDEEGNQSSERLTPEMQNLHRMFRQRYLESFEKGGIGKPENIQNYINIFKNNILDKKIWLCNVKGIYDGKKVILDGDVNAIEFKKGIEDILKQLGLTEILNLIKVLPEDSIPNTPYGFIKSSDAWMFRESDLKSEPLNQVLYGEAIKLLKISNDKKFYLIQSPDAYIGWMQSEDIIPVSVDKYSEFQKKNNKAAFYSDSKINLKDNPETEIEIKANTTLIISDKVKGSENINLLLPDGKSAIVHGKLVKQINPDIEKQRTFLKSLAEELMHSKYKWGGITKDGIDCSGFTQYLYKRVGINLPRDADEQASVGKIVAYNDSIEGLIPGDLIFFITRNGRIGHVAISLGGYDFVHASSPEVHYGSFDPKSELFDEKYRKIFFFAKRVCTAGFPCE